MPGVSVNLHRTGVRGVGKRGRCTHTASLQQDIDEGLLVNANIHIAGLAVYVCLFNSMVLIHGIWALAPDVCARMPAMACLTPQQY